MRLAMAACCAALSLAAPARAQMQLIIPWPPGGGTDIIGRLIQPVLSEALDTQIVIRNVGGATGTIGTAEVVRAKPDGQTLLLTSMAAVAIQPSFLAKPPYQADQLAAVCLVAEAPATLMTPKATGLRTVADVIARAKADPGQLPYASGGVGGLGHLSMTGFSRAAGISLNHIPFRGSGDSVLAMQSGTVLMLAAEANLVAQYGLHAIAVFGAERARDVPDAPTMRELGYDLVFPLWTGIFAPAGTPEPILARLDAACAKTLKTPSVVEAMTKASHPIRYLDHRAFGAYVAAEAVKYRELIAQSGLRQAD
jgi:tripartite-type tricarboxylate transporter receptor subunit TctC